MTILIPWSLVIMAAVVLVILIIDYLTDFYGSYKRRKRK